MIVVTTLAILSVSFLLLLVGAKVVWNFILPYEMIRMKKPQPISFFPLIELVPMSVAVPISWTVGLTGWFSSWNLCILGLGAIALSYAHFCIVAIVVGICRWNRKEDKPE
jgi:hypothetical protein